MIINELLYVAVVPLVVATATAFVLQRLLLPPRAMWAASVGLGYLAGHFTTLSRAGAKRAAWAFFRPHDARDWLPLAVLLAMGITVLAAYAPRAWRRWPFGLAALLVIGVPARLLAGGVAGQWSIIEKLLHLALLTATLGLTWLLLASARDEGQRRLRVVLLMFAACGTAAVALLSGALITGKLCGVVAAALAGTALAQIETPNGLSGAAGIVTIALGGLVLLGVFYADLAPSNAALAFLSIVAAAGPLPDALHSRPAWQQSAARTALCLVPLAIAVAASA